jgi:hypothetical protein
MSVLMDMHEGHRERQARLLHGHAPPPRPAPGPRPISPFIREVKRQRMLAWQGMMYLRANPVPSVWEYPPVVRYDHCDGSGTARRTLAAITAEVAFRHGYSVNDLKSARRTKDIVRARHEAFWRCREETEHSLPAIGRFMGGKDHTTVLYGIGQHEKRMNQAALLLTVDKSGNAQQG